MNSFGRRFRWTTWGESHGRAIGVVVDGCPSGLPLNETDVQAELERRAPGKLPWTSPRQEPDQAEILSGLYQGSTTGAPISIIIWNRDARRESYQPIENLYRPGHAQSTYLAKYGVYDPHGAGRASARETACRVAAGAIAQKLLAQQGITVVGCLRQVGEACGTFSLPTTRPTSGLFCPCPSTEKRWEALLTQIVEEKDSIGGIVEASVWGLPAGIGEPIYGKLEAQLADALLSIPACKGFEIGAGFGAAAMRGSVHNDYFTHKEGHTLISETNYAGGVLAGISTGMPLTVRAAFKPTSSIGKPQPTLDKEGNGATLLLPEGSRHDPCVAIRAVPVVEAMVALVVIDQLLLACPLPGN